jgi:hypothetical protein
LTPVSWPLRLAGWLRSRWQLATIPERERCTACTRRVGVRMTTTEIVIETGEIRREWLTRYCDTCLHLSVGEPHCKTCGRPFWPSFSHLYCQPAAGATSTT